MTPDFWTERWKKNEIGFHQKSVHELLERYWPEVGAKPRSSVLVPLAGKSLDMVWLVESGHEVLGIELSELAVGDFFKERGLKPEAVSQASGTLNFGGPYSLWCGDFFAVPASATAHIGAVYDRASLVALPPAMRAAYAKQLMALTPKGARMLLISLDYDPSQMNGPPFPVPPREVAQLFQPYASVRLLEEREVISTHPQFISKGVTSLRESAFVLERL
jgi:thiopurine S-methyltransferase